MVIPDLGNHDKQIGFYILVYSYTALTSTLILYIIPLFSFILDDISWTNHGDPEDQ